MHENQTQIKQSTRLKQVDFQLYESSIVTKCQLMKLVGVVTLVGFMKA